MGVATAATHALLLGGLGAYLTFVYTSRAGEPWAFKDYLFVAGVVLAVFYNRLSTMKYETLVQNAHAAQRHRKVHALDRVEWVHGAPVRIEPNKVTLLLFFGTWCSDSRAALQRLERLRKMFTHGAVEMVALTQETQEELVAYEQKGRNASHFRPLREFPFSIAIEDGLMSKEFLVRFEIYKLPHLFVIGKDQSVVWYGAPSHTGIEDIVRGALAAENVAPTPTALKLKEELLVEELDDCDQGYDASTTATIVAKKEN